MNVALVTGATGAIGPSLVAHLLANGYQVRAFSRHRPALGLMPATAEHIQGDITDKDSLKKALDNVDLVLHLAALLHIENPPPQMASLYQAVNVAGTQNVV